MGSLELYGRTSVKGIFWGVILFVLVFTVVIDMC